MGGNWGTHEAGAGTGGIVLWLRSSRTTHVTRVTARWVGGNVGVRRGEVGLFEVGGSLQPTDLLHVGHPDVVSSLAGPDGKANEGDDVSKKRRPKDETERGNRLSGTTESIDATDGTTKGGGSLSTGGKPHDPEEREPANLDGKLGCEGAVTEESDDDHWKDGSQVEDGGSNAKGRVGKIKGYDIRGLLQGICGKT